MKSILSIAIIQSIACLCLSLTPHLISLLQFSSVDRGRPEDGAYSSGPLDGAGGQTKWMRDCNRGDVARENPNKRAEAKSSVKQLRIVGIAHIKNIPIYRNLI